MGLSPFRSCFTNSCAPAPNPDPKRWELLEVAEFDGAHVLKVRYADCTNFEGLKIMVYKGRYWRRDQTLDPHFSEEATSPVARFRPDGAGWAMACALAESISMLSKQE